VSKNSFAQRFAERRRLLYLTLVKLQTGRITTLWLYSVSYIEKRRQVIKLTNWPT